MKKVKFKYLYSFKYDNKEYIYLISQNYSFYFLEYNRSTSAFDYPNINTFKELYNKFYPTSSNLSFDMKEYIKKSKQSYVTWI